MATDVMTLREYADMLDEIADGWEGDQPAILIGDVTGNVNVTAKDGHSTFGAVGYAQECFESNGVMELSNGDMRFYGTMLMSADGLTDEAQAQLEASRDGEGEESEPGICEECSRESEPVEKTVVNDGSVSELCIACQDYFYENSELPSESEDPEQVEA